MKRFVKLVMATIAMVVAVGCSKSTTTSGNGYLDVTANNIKGTWRMESFESGKPLAEGSYYYISFNRAERTFVSYDNTESMGLRKRSGRFDIVTDGAAVIYGDFDYSIGPSDWVHRYYVRNLTAERMEWYAIDDESINLTFVRAELPEWISTDEE